MLQCCVRKKCTKKWTQGFSVFGKFCSYFVNNIVFCNDKHYDISIEFLLLFCRK
jgi:hypothetical protein